MHADDPPHRIALGCAIGMFLALTPTMGIQMVTAVFLSWLFRANKIVAAGIVWISNPLTAIPIYYCCFLLGQRITNDASTNSAKMDWNWWLQLYHPPTGWWNAVTFYWVKFLDIATPLWVGSLIVAGISGYVTYYLVLHCVRGYRMRRWGQLVPPQDENDLPACHDTHSTPPATLAPKAKGPGNPSAKAS